MKCKICGNEEKFVKAGKGTYRSGKYQMHKCMQCGHRFKGRELI